MAAAPALSSNGRAWERNLSMDELESKLDQLERETLELNHNDERLQRTHAELGELQVLLEKGGHFFHAAQQMASHSSHQITSASPGREASAPLLSPESQDVPVSGKDLKIRPPPVHNSHHLHTCTLSLSHSLSHTHQKTTCREWRLAPRWLVSASSPA
jgi:hypothetical protein